MKLADRISSDPRLVAGMETGGTKFNCAFFREKELLGKERIPTTTPAETLQYVIDFIKKEEKNHGDIAAFGIGSFGPIDLHESSSTYGRVTSTPKPGWQNADIVRPIREAFGVPVVFDTDVNAAAFGEWLWGAAREVDNFIYLTIGTGIGGGGMVNGQLIHGLTHPEMGHIRISRDRRYDAFEGICPYHGDCFEGIASGEAIEQRWGHSAENLPESHPAWEFEAIYIAKALSNYIMTLSPQKIILGGGVMQQDHLFPLIRKELLKQLNEYIADNAILKRIDSYVVPPFFGQKAGLIGSCALAYRALINTPDEMEKRHGIQ